MNSPTEPGRLLQIYPLGKPQALTVSHQGLRYSGEAILSDRWRVGCGQPLDGDVYFRVVLLRHRREVPPTDIQDSRIAVCIPARSPSKGRRHVGKELTALRETQALYLTQREAETGFIRSYLQSERDQLEGLLVRNP